MISQMAPGATIVIRMAVFFQRPRGFGCPGLTGRREPLTIFTKVKPTLSQTGDPQVERRTC